MNRKPFDLEAAKAGQLFYSTQFASEGYTFIGFARSGDIVGESKVGVLTSFDPQHVYMKPKKRTVWVNLYPRLSNGYFYPSEEEANRKAGVGRVDNKAFPIEIEE